MKAHISFSEQLSEKEKNECNIALERLNIIPAEDDEPNVEHLSIISLTENVGYKKNFQCLTITINVLKEFANNKNKGNIFSLKEHGTFFQNVQLLNQHVALFNDLSKNQIKTCKKQIEFMGGEVVDMSHEKLDIIVAVNKIDHPNNVRLLNPNEIDSKYWNNIFPNENQRKSLLSQASQNHDDIKRVSSFPKPQIRPTKIKRQPKKVLKIIPLHLEKNQSKIDFPKTQKNEIKNTKDTISTINSSNECIELNTNKTKNKFENNSQNTIKTSSKSQKPARKSNNSSQNKASNGNNRTIESYLEIGGYKKSQSSVSNSSQSSSFSSQKTLKQYYEQSQIDIITSFQNQNVTKGQNKQKGLTKLSKKSYLIQTEESTDMSDSSSETDKYKGEMNSNSKTNNNTLFFFKKLIDFNDNLADLSIFSQTDNHEKSNIQLYNIDYDSEIKIQNNEASSNGKDPLVNWFKISDNQSND